MSSGKKLLDMHDVYHQGSRTSGQLRILDTGLGWKCTDEREPVVTFAGREIKAAQWQRVARGYELRITLVDPKDPRKEGTRHRFDNLKGADFDIAKKAIHGVTNGEIELEHKDVSVKGWNWGKMDVRANDLAFLVQQRVSFEIPLTSISNSNMAGKNEVALDFNPPPVVPTPPGVKPERPADELVEMRFYIPQRGSGKKSRAGSQASGDEEDEEVDPDDAALDSDGNEISAAELFHKTIMDQAELGEQAGDAIASFVDVSVVTPRGRYEIEMHEEHLRLHGKTYDYKVLYKHIHRQFLLPRADQMYQQLIVGLDPPLRQGQTKYPWLIMQWDVSEEIDVELNIEDEKIEKDYPGMAKSYSAPTYEITSVLFKRLAKKPITGPGDFRSSADLGCIKCNVKAMQGELHFLDKSMLFVAKTPILVDYNRITKANISRVAGVLRSFDITVKLSTELEHTFTSVNKDEYKHVKEYLTSKKVRVHEIGEDTSRRALEALDLGSEEELDDSDEDRRGKTKSQGRREGDEDEDSEDDGDFDDESAPSSPEDTDNDSDDDGGAESDVTDDMVEAAKKKKAAGGKKKAVAAPVAAPTNGSSKAAATKEKGKADKDKAKSKETIEDSDDDAMDVDGGSDGEPAQKKQKTA
ncbi:hypothetical protein FFLO_04438 [Filobasidium floriforme]|uniref:FACT complex subunit POB3 n=1 Tax=Filobasidium floriforme TaxID=5210 RepID=A0A8K0NPV0_9TREE|nr:putative subunit of the heterodimeric FACT complex [Filobasidium floriforme]KAG7531317.1 hypothetical protein FFLO_04438 [Filobasidium floriforme]KAH8088567.1 putative subunit of the heterodimeric FACT complex [Filobasidium floriforme]